MRTSMCCCSLIWSMFAGVPRAAEPQLLAYQLDNGLSVTLRPVETAQQVALVVLYSVGGDHDPARCSGLAQNVYGVAFGIGRRAQLGIHSGRLTQAIEAVRAEDLDRARARFEPTRRAAVVVTVHPES